MKRVERLAVAAMFASGLLWGLSWIPVKHFGRAGLSGVGLTIASYGTIGVLVIPWLWRRREAMRSQRGLVVANGLLGGLGNVFFVVTMMQGDVIRSMLLFYLAPVWGVVGGRVFLHERITPSRVVAVALALTGATLVLGGPGALAGPVRLVDAFAIGAGFFYAMQNVAARGADQVPVELKAASLFTGCAVVGLVAFPISGESIPHFDAWLGVQVALFAGLWLVAAIGAQLYGVSHLDAGRSSVLIIFELVAAVASAWLLTDEALPVAGWIGGVLIVSAALLEARPQSEPKGAPA